MAIKVKTMNKIIKLKKQDAQTFITVMMMAFVLSIFATTMLFLFRQDAKFTVHFDKTMKKQELAAIALEHALYQLQTGSNWYRVPLTGFKYDKEYTTELGNYSIYLVKGNLFINNPNDPTTRQGQKEFRTIGIKIKLKTGETKQYYAVVKKGYAGVLISKGFINLPCTNAMADHVRFYWGDIYSANPADGKCRIPLIHVGYGTTKPEYWMPEVYAKGNIYTALSATGGIWGVNYTFGYTYTDMSPSAKCHPYSPFAKAPSLDFDIYKYYAWKNGAYYGPATIDGQPNPYYIPGNDLSVITQANVRTKIVDKLRYHDSALFIDTTDGKPVRPPVGATPANTYCGTTHVSTNTIAIYDNDRNEYWTRGYFFVMGPLILKGNDPDDPFGNNSSRITGVARPDNFYYPQNDDGDHYNYTAGNLSNCYLDRVKHAGLLYVNGELQIKRRGSSFRPTNICIYGTIFLDEYGSLSIDYSSSSWGEKPYLYVFFNQNQNLFGYMGENVALLTFNELTWLIPTPVPEYPF